jgi:hypothetical protein
MDVRFIYIFVHVWGSASGLERGGTSRVVSSRTFSSSLKVRALRLGLAWSGYYTITCLGLYPLYLLSDNLLKQKCK